MKKNISINISGIIFHIEEDGYQRLENYLNSIKKYFSSFDESEEILLDIENRIAEIFLAKLNDGKQVITAEDVEMLISTMGNVSDFQAVEDVDPQAEFGAETEASQEEEEKATPEDKKLYRDRKRQIIGGVASGIAHYLRVDPLWIRLILIIFMADLFFTASFGSIVLVGYLVLWAILPGRIDLEEDTKVKKIYRDPDGQVLGGVAAGIANYFGVNVVAIRILFVLFLLLGGASFFIYVVLWIIVPQARSVTEKLEMKGEPVTLENIENSIKDSLNVDAEAKESTLTKVLLAPFRLFAEFIRVLGRIAGPFFRFIVEIIRFAFGLFLIVWSLSLLYALALSIGLYAGAEGWWMFPFWIDNADVSFPKGMTLEVLQNTITPWLLVPLYVAALIPILLLMLLGISAIAKRWVASSLVSWSLFGIWILALIVSAITILQTWYDIRDEGEKIDTTELSISPDHVLVVQGDKRLRNAIHMVDLYIYPSDDETVRLERIVRARGGSPESIQEHINMITYDVDVMDTVLTIPHQYEFTDDAIFRDQQVRLALYIPRGQSFYVDKNLYGLLRYSRLYKSGLNHVYQFDDEDRRPCIDCETPFPETTEDRRNEVRERVSSEERTLDKSLDPFDELVLRGNISVLIQSGDENRLQVTSDTDNLELQIRQLEDRLYISQERDYGKPTPVVITTNGFTEIVVEDKASVDLAEFRTNTLEISADNEAVVSGEVFVTDLDLQIEEEARIRLDGTANTLNVEARDRASLRAYDLVANEVAVDATDRSDIRLRAEHTLRINSNSSVAIRYRGTPSSVDTEGRVLEVNEE